MAVAITHHVLSDAILVRCAERAPIYDRENRFFTEDFEELRQAGYLRMNVPAALGGMGLSLAQVCQEQRRLAYHAEVQHAIADMALELEAIGPHLDRIAQDCSDGVDHGMLWGAKLVAVKHRAVEGAWKVVDMALDLAGGFGIFKQAMIERLFRDARLGRIHPANAFVTREFVAKTVLGINSDQEHSAHYSGVPISCPAIARSAQNAVTPDAESSPTSACCPPDTPPGAVADPCSGRSCTRQDGPTPARRQTETCRWGRG